MTREETQKIMQMLAVAYPNFYKDKSKEFRNLALDVWAVALSDYPFGFIVAGMKNLLQTKTFPPAAAEVIQSAKDVAMDWMMADYLRKSGADIPADAWLCERGRPIQFGEWCEQKKMLGTYKNKLLT